VWVLKWVLSICRVSQILIIASSDTEIKWVQWPSLGNLLSTFIDGGTNAISATNYLCEVIILDWHIFLILIIDYALSSSSTAPSLNTSSSPPAPISVFLLEVVILWSVDVISQTTIYPFKQPPNNKLGFSGWNSIVVTSIGVSNK
jgi:hypothetical protein